MILLDTHVWIWWVSDPGRLSARANEEIDKAAGEKSILISSISVWEVAMLEAKGRIELSMAIDDWVSASEGLPFIEFVPVNNRIALRAVHLPNPFHNDPADRVIVATALFLNAPIVTTDKRIIEYPHVKTIS